MEEMKKLFNFRYSSGCIHCGKRQTWRFKILDPMNRAAEICPDCLKVVFKGEVENVRKEADKGDRTDGLEDRTEKTPDREPSPEKQKRKYRKKPAVDVARQEVQTD